MDGDDQTEKTDRLLLSSLRYWEVEHDLIEERLLIRMVVRSESICVFCCVQVDVPARNMGKRTRVQKVDNSQVAFAARGAIFNQQSARHQKTSRKENPGSVVVKS
jgi:hypothetical protein